MALKKGEQFALFEVDESEVAPVEPATVESLQPALVISSMTKFPNKLSRRTNPTAGQSMAVPGADAEDVEPHAADNLGEDVAVATSLSPAGESADGHAIIVTAEGTYTPSGQTLTDGWTRSRNSTN